MCKTKWATCGWFSTSRVRFHNYKELGQEVAAKGGRCLRSSSDTEILLYAYQLWGEACLEKLNGMFAFGIYA